MDVERTQLESKASFAETPKQLHDALQAASVRCDASGVETSNDTDARDMLRLGRSQELRRNFKSFSVLGLAMTTMSTWVAMLMTSLFSLINGGRAGTIWVYLATWLCTFTLAASLAELASMAPTSGGQYRECICLRDHHKF